MAALALDTDLEARLGRALTSAEDAKAPTLLADASALIRDWTRYQFEAVSGEVARLRPVGMQLRLKKKPVTAVNSVTAINWAGAPTLVLPVGAWGWDGIDIITIAPLSSGTWINLPDVEVEGYPDTYEVDYDHGEAGVPATVVKVCCDMVIRVLTSPSQTEGMSSEHIGQYSYQMSQQVNGGSPGASVRLTEVDKDNLRDAGYGKKRATTIQLSI